MPHRRQEDRDTQIGDRDLEPDPSSPPQVRRQARARAATLAGGSLTVLVVLVGCGTERTSIVAPKGPRAERISDLWWVMLVLAVAVFAAVMVLLLAALFRPRRSDAERLEPPGHRQAGMVGTVHVE